MIISSGLVDLPVMETDFSIVDSRGINVTLLFQMHLTT